MSRSFLAVGAAAWYVGEMNLRCPPELLCAPDGMGPFLVRLFPALPTLVAVWVMSLVWSSTMGRRTGTGKP